MDEMAEEIVPVLRVADAGLAVEWWGRLGFAKVWEHRFEPGFPAFVEVARGRVKVFLSEHIGDAPPGGLVHLRLRDIDAVAAGFAVDVTEQPWGREMELTDPDGNRVRVGTPPG